MSDAERAGAAEPTARKDLSGCPECGGWITQVGKLTTHQRVVIHDGEPRYEEEWEPQLDDHDVVGYLCEEDPSHRWAGLDDLLANVIDGVDR
ncbi:hypothetical protein [Miltoncostaea oceani]|uniref:hypothetical protein n=1 Tax=Miltoncostaea oceani TaxID=2843216 RepID=UPI001C3C53BF|nr:hypothetical protein [Miltoncostaea oceani]